MDDEVVIDDRTIGERLDVIEAKLDEVLSVIGEVRPLVATGHDIAEKLAAGGPQALMSLILGR